MRKRVTGAVPPGWLTRGGWVVLLAIAALSPNPVPGATLQPQSLQALIRDADLIVRGRVEAIKPTPRTGGALSTIVVISVREQWKGPRLSTLRVAQPQGTEGEITQAVPGLPTFRVGEDVILFVVRAERGTYGVLGGKQGKFSIRTDPQSGRPVVEDLAGTRLELTQFLGSLSPLKKPAP